MGVRIVLTLVVALAWQAGRVEAQWIDELPPEVRASILWSADYEQGNLHQWQSPTSKYPGGGILNTGGREVQAKASRLLAHSGLWSVAATIKGARRSKNGKRAVRLMRWTDRPWDDQGQYLPKAAYYSTWMYFPHKYNSSKYAPWDPGDGGWWNVFQFKANDENDVSTSMFSLGAYFNDDRREIEFGLNSHYGKFYCHEQRWPRPVPVGKWFHVEALYVVSSVRKGTVKVWQDGIPIFHVRNAQTAIRLDKEFAAWGIGNYTDHIAGGLREGEATLYFDDSIISRKRVSKFISYPAKNRKIQPGS